jgi:hypothetical protein
VLPAFKQVITPRLPTYDDKIKTGWRNLYQLIGCGGTVHRLKEAVKHDTAFFQYNPMTQELSGVVTATPFSLNGLPVKNTWYVGSQASVDATQFAGIRVLVPLVRAARERQVHHLVMIKSERAAAQYQRYFEGHKPLSEDFIGTHLNTSPWLKGLPTLISHNSIARPLHRLAQRYLPKWLVLTVPEQPTALEQRLSKRL